MDDNNYSDSESSEDNFDTRAIDSIDNDLTSSVKVTNNVDTSTPGVYRIIYSVTNSAGVTITKTRTVIVK